VALGQWNMLSFRRIKCDTACDRFDRGLVMELPERGTTDTAGGSRTIRLYAFKSSVMGLGSNSARTMLLCGAGAASRRAPYDRIARIRSRSGR